LENSREDYHTSISAVSEELNIVIEDLLKRHSLRGFDAIIWPLPILTELTTRRVISHVLIMLSPTLQ